jgi:hypothetical protein
MAIKRCKEAEVATLREEIFKEVTTATEMMTQRMMIMIRPTVEMIMRLDDLYFDLKLNPHFLNTL